MCVAATSAGYHTQWAEVGGREWEGESGRARVGGREWEGESERVRGWRAREQHWR